MFHVDFVNFSGARVSNFPDSDFVAFCAKFAISSLVHDDFTLLVMFMLISFSSMMLMFLDLVLVSCDSKNFIKNALFFFSIQGNQHWCLLCRLRYLVLIEASFFFRYLIIDMLGVARV